MSEQSFKAYKFLLDPTKEQEEAMLQAVGAARFAYNYSVAENMRRNKRRMDERDRLIAKGFEGDALNHRLKEFVDKSKDTLEPANVASSFTLAKIWLTPLREEHRKAEELGIAPEGFEEAWAHKVFRRAFVSGLRNADKATKNFFSSITGKRKGQRVGAPRFKKKGRSKDSVTVEGEKMGAKGVTYGRGKKQKTINDYKHVYAATFGEIKTKESTKRMVRAIDRGGVAKSFTISKHANKWYISFLVASPEIVAQPSRRQQANGVVGVDLGIKELAILSTGEVVKNPRFFASNSVKLKKLQRKAAKAKRGSNRSKVLYAKIAKLHNLIAQQRKTERDRLVKHLASNYVGVAIEDLNVKGMSSSAKGTIEKPGKNVKAKSGLNRAIQDAAFGAIRVALENKAKEYGTAIFPVGRFVPTSKTCSNCGVIKTTLSLKERIYHCEDCGFIEDRDLNAAINIAKVGAPAEAKLALNRRESINGHRGGSVLKVLDFAVISPVKCQSLSS